jgi:hypothetical protein
VSFDSLLLQEHSSSSSSSSSSNNQSIICLPQRRSQLPDPSGIFTSKVVTYVTNPINNSHLNHHQQQSPTASQGKDGPLRGCSGHESHAAGIVKT